MDRISNFYNCTCEEYDNALQNMCCETKKITCVKPISDLEMYSIAKIMAHKVYEMYKCQIQHSSTITKENLALFHDGEHEKYFAHEYSNEDLSILEEQVIKVSLENYVREKDFYAGQRQQSEDNVDILILYRDQCQDNMIDARANKHNFGSMFAGVVWMHLSEFLQKLIEFYTSLAQRWMVLESMFHEISDHFDANITNKYHHNITENGILVNEKELTDVLIYYETEWQLLFGSNDK